MSKLASYLVQSRHGIYYLRDTSGGRERRVSLRTRDPIAARMAAYRFGAAKMAGDKNLSFARLAGFVLMGFAVHLARTVASSHQQKSTYGRALTVFFSAIVLVNLDAFISLFSWTFFEQETQKSVLSYAISGGGVGSASLSTVLSIIAFVQFVGLLAFIRGWLVLNAIGKRQDATLGKGITHIVGGVFAVNIVVVAKITAVTFGIKGLSMLMQQLAA